MIISIEGNIGCGKSTLLSFLNDNYKVVQEDVSEWKEWIEDFYKDKSKNSFGFQMRVLLSQSYIIFNEEITFHERSPSTCNNIFGQILLDNKYLSQKEHELCKEFSIKYCWKPDIVLYIQTDPLICEQRINKRGRNGENISLDYIKDLHKQHENIYNKNKDSNVYIINGNQDVELLYREVKDIIFNIT